MIGRVHQILRGFAKKPRTRRDAHLPESVAVGREPTRDLVLVRTHGRDRQPPRLRGSARSQTSHRDFNLPHEGTQREVFLVKVRPERRAPSAPYARRCPRAPALELGLRIPRRFRVVCVAARTSIHHAHGNVSGHVGHHRRIPQLGQVTVHPHGHRGTVGVLGKGTNLGDPHRILGNFRLHRGVVHVPIAVQRDCKEKHIVSQSQSNCPYDVKINSPVALTFVVSSGPCLYVGKSRVPHI